MADTEQPAPPPEVQVPAVAPVRPVDDRLSTIKSRQEMMALKRQAEEERLRVAAEEEAAKAAIRKAKAEAARAEQRRKEAEERERKKEFQRVMEQNPHFKSDAEQLEGSDDMEPVPLNERVMLSKQQLEVLQGRREAMMESLVEHIKELDRLKRDSDKLSALKKRLLKEEQKACGRPEQRSAVRYPIDDSLLLDDHPDGLRNRPLLIKRLSLATALQAPVLRCWDFLHNFGSALYLSEFKLDDFVNAIHFESGPTVLLSEIHCRLLIAILQDHRCQRLWAEAVGLKAPPKEKKFHRMVASRRPVPSLLRDNNIPINPKEEPIDSNSSQPAAEVEVGAVPLHRGGANAASMMVNQYTWQTMLRLILKRLRPYVRAQEAAAADVVPGGARDDAAAWDRAWELLAEMEYCALPPASKVALLELLVAAVYETKYIQRIVLANSEQRKKLETARKEEISRITRNQRDETASRKERAVAELKGKFEKDAISMEKANSGKSPSQNGDDVEEEEETEDVEMAEGSSTAGKKGGGGGKKKINVREPTKDELAAAIEELVDQDICGGGAFTVRDVIANDEASAVADEEEENEDSGDEASELLLATMSRGDMMKRRREREVRVRGRDARRAEAKRAAAGREARLNAVNIITTALSKDDVKGLETGLRLGRSSGLEGDDGEGRWMAPQMRAAYKALAALKDRMCRAEINSRYTSQLADKFVRTEPLGSDRYGRRYWVLEGDSRLFIEEVKRRPTALPIKGNLAVEPPPVDLEKLPKATTLALKLAADARNVDAMAVEGENGQAGGAKKAELGAQYEAYREPLYDFEDHCPAMYESSFFFYDSEEEFRDLILSLDGRGINERQLRDALQLRFDMAELQKSVAAGNHAAVKASEGFKWRSEGSEYVGQRVLRKFGRHRHATGVVKGWVPADENEGLTLWHVIHDDGDEEDLDETEVKRAIEEAQAASAMIVEQDAAGAGEVGDGVSGVKDEMQWEEEDEFAKYKNALSPGVTAKELGIEALRYDIMKWEADLYSGRTRATRESANNPARLVWLRAIKDANTVLLLRQCLMDLETMLHAQQEVPDVIDDARMVMEAKGWKFEEEAHPAVGRPVRCFLLPEGTDKSDNEDEEESVPRRLVNGIVQAYMPAQGRGKDKEGDSKKGKKAGLGEKWFLQLDGSRELEVGERAIALYLKYAEENVSEPIEEEEEALESALNEEKAAAASEEEKDEDDESDEEEEEEEESSEEEAYDDEATEDEEEGGTASKGSSRSGVSPRAPSSAPAVSSKKVSKTLWPNWAVRQKWLRAVSTAATVSCVGLAWMALAETAVRFGASVSSLVMDKPVRGTGPVRERVTRSDKKGGGAAEEETSRSTRSLRAKRPAPASASTSASSSKRRRTTR